MQSATIPSTEVLSTGVLLELFESDLESDLESEELPVSTLSWDETKVSSGLGDWAKTKLLPSKPPVSEENGLGLWAKGNSVTVDSTEVNPTLVEVVVVTEVCTVVEVWV